MIEHFDLEHLFPELNIDCIKVETLFSADPLDNSNKFIMRFYLLDRPSLGTHDVLSGECFDVVSYECDYTELVNKPDIVVQDIKETIYERYCRLLDTIIHKGQLYDDIHRITDPTRNKYEEYLKYALDYSGFSLILDYSISTNIMYYKVASDFHWTPNLVSIDDFGYACSMSTVSQLIDKGLDDFDTIQWIEQVRHNIVSRIKSQLKEKLGIIDN